jgi:hypothetical protein
MRMMRGLIFRLILRRIDMNQNDIAAQERDDFEDRMEKKNTDFSNQVLRHVLAAGKEFMSRDVPDHLKRIFLNQALYKTARAINFPPQTMEGKSEAEKPMCYNAYLDYSCDFGVEFMKICEALHSWRPAEEDANASDAGNKP